LTVGISECVIGGSPGWAPNPAEMGSLEPAPHPNVMRGMAQYRRRKRS
jgi:hypothetical protein